MAQEKPAHTETQEQSIKSRKHQLYDAEPKTLEGEGLVQVKSVQDYLKETPATPITTAIKAALWGTGTLVVLLFITVLVVIERRPKRSMAAETGAERLLASTPEPLPPAKDAPAAKPAKPETAAAPQASEPPQPKEEPDKKQNNNKKDGAAADKKKKESKPKEPPKVPTNVAWSVTVDPPAETLELAAEQSASVPIPATSEVGIKVLFPSTPSPFVAVGGNKGDAEAREVWDLRSNKRTGVIRGKLPLQPPLALSADGTYLAGTFLSESSDKDDKDKKDDKNAKDEGKKKGKKATISVWSFKTGKEVKQIKLKAESVGFLDFAGPDQLVTLSDDGQWFQIWNFQTGEAVDEPFPAPGVVDARSLTLSPGRKFLAMAVPADNRLWIYDLTARGPAGLAQLPKEAGPGWSCAGITFSPGGTELAAVFEWAGKPSILCWETSTGKLIANHALDERYGIRRFPNDQGRALEWLPDRSGWLVYGQALIERENGHRFWSLPVYYPDFPPTPRRLINGDRWVLVWGQGRAQVVRTAAMPKDTLASARQIVRSGGSAVDAVLPAVGHPDWSAQRVVPSAAASWSATPDPASMPAKSLISRPIVLKNWVEEIRGVYCSGAEAAQALVAIRALERDELGGNALAPGLSQWIERYDLANGKRLGRNEVPTASDLVAFSPDAGRLIMRDAANGDRLDIYSAADMKYLGGWRPYEKESGIDRMVVWTAFLDQHRALTINPAGKLVLWGLPACRAMYTVKDACQGTPVLSPGRKFVAGFSGGFIRFFEAATGKRVGETATPSSDDGGRPGPRAAAFRTDGQQLAALLSGGQIVRIDLATGKALSEVRSPVPQAAFLEWCGNRHVLINNQSLVDLDRQWEVWRYAAGLPALGSPDGRHWAAVEAYTNEPAYLAAFTIPEKGLDKIVKLVADKKAPALLRMQVPVTLRIDIIGAPKGGEAFRQALAEQLAAQLRANDIPIADGQPVTLLVRAEALDTGEKEELRNLVPGMKDDEQGKKKIPNKYVECEVALVDSAGKVPLEPKQQFMLRDIGNLAAGKDEKDPAGFFENKLWDLAKARLMAVTLPPFVARNPEGGVVRFPGFSNLGQTVRK
jgi:hypothetical protein